jgi:folate-binding Fe-S cluster repair protein YgfZ
MTCSVYDVTDSQSRISAFCDPKGRVCISTFFLVKNENGFLLILPQALLTTVFRKPFGALQAPS